MLEKCTGVCYAGDTTLLCSDTTPNEIVEKLNHDINILSHWFRSSMLSLDLSKAQYMIFNLCNKDFRQTKRSLSFRRKNRKSLLFQVLGHLLSELYWQQHVNRLCSKLLRNNYLIISVKNLLPTHIKKNISFTHLHSHLMYGLIVWGPMLTESQLNRIFKQQKSNLRLVTNANYNAHTDPLFKLQKILKFPDMITMELKKALIKKWIWISFPKISKSSHVKFNKIFLCKSVVKWLEMPMIIKAKITVKSF